MRSEGIDSAATRGDDPADGRKHASEEEAERSPAGNSASMNTHVICIDVAGRRVDVSFGPFLGMSRDTLVRHR